MFTDPKKLGLVFALSVVTAYLGMRFGWLMDAKADLAAGFMYAYDNFLSSLLIAPVAIGTTSGAGMGALVGFIVPWAVFAYLASQEGNFDPGKEHGDARWATPKEIASLSDPRHVINNRIITRRHWQALNKHGEGRERSELTRRMSDMNANVYVLGTSGARKTVGVVKPAIMNCVDEPTAVRMLKEIGDKKGLKMLGPGVAEKPDAGCSGADLFLTDPKGDTLKECGGLLERAGFEIRSFNTVDMAHSQRFNPLAYIPVREVDGCDPYELDMRAKFYVNGELCWECTLGGSKASEVTASSLGDSGVVASARAPHFHVHETSIDDTIDEGSLDEQTLLEYQEAGLVDDPDFDPTALTAEEAKARQQYRDAIHGISYRRTDVDFCLNLSNNSDSPVTVEVVFDLPPGFDFQTVQSVWEVKAAKAEEFTWQQQRREKAEGYDRFRVRATLSPRGESDPNAGLYPAGSIVVAGRPKVGRVPDGVELVSMVNCLVQNFKGHQDVKSKDPFWDNAEMLLFQALISYLFERWEDPRYWTLPEVMDLIKLAGVDMDKTVESDLDKLMRRWEEGMDDMVVEAEANVFGRPGSMVVKAPTPEGPHSAQQSLAVHCYKCFKQAAPETIQSILVSCNTSLVRLFSDPIRDLLSDDELELNDFGNPDRKQAFFAICSDTDDSFDFLFAMIAFFAIKLTCQNAYKKYGGKLPRQLQIVFDEFANIGTLSTFPRTIAVTRSRNIAITICLQSKSQAEKNYSSEDAKTIANNCSTLLFLAGKDDDTLNWLSELAGEETVHEKKRSETKGREHSRSESRESMARKLITKSQLANLPHDMCVAFTPVPAPIKDKKYLPAEHPLYPFIDPGEGSEGYREDAGDKDPEASKGRKIKDPEKRAEWREGRKRKCPRAYPVFDKPFDFVSYRDESRKERYERARTAR